LSDNKLGGAKTGSEPLRAEVFAGIKQKKFLIKLFSKSFGGGGGGF